MKAIERQHNLSLNLVWEGLMIDGHLDLAWNALALNRDLRHNTHAIRKMEGQPGAHGKGAGMVSLPDLVSAQTWVCLATIYARVGMGDGWPVTVPTVAHAAAWACAQWSYYDMLAREQQITFIVDRNGLESHLEARAQPGVVLAMEGADPIAHPDELGLWWERGLRVLALTHNGECRYAGGTGSTLGLLPKGYLLLQGMEQLGIVLDVSHASDRTFEEALDAFRGSVVASHSACRALVPHPRQISDDHIRRIAARRGVIGLPLDAWMLVPGYERGVTSRPAFSAYIDHLDHICQVSGTATVAAIGSDLDGGFGTEQVPLPLDTIADLEPQIRVALGDRGYTSADIENILHGNWERLLRTALPAPRWKLLPPGREQVVWEGVRGWISGVAVVETPAGWFITTSPQAAWVADGWVEAVPYRQH